MPEVLPASIHRAVYLDADLVVRRDLSPLFDIDLRGSVLGAVRDFAIKSTAHPLSGVRERANPRPYFNSGVLVIDVPGCRESELGTRALEYAAASREPLPSRDQDALNAVTDGWHELADEWNLQMWNVPLPKRLMVTDPSAYRDGRQVFRTAAVLHFVGPKPWYPSCETRGTTAWVRALSLSGWFEPSEFAAWLLFWLARRAGAWPAIAGRRWRARLAAVARARQS
jgi:UDP-D-galactose:(glucosyl)LPS alpha-1,3-D-galactosyltransferase